MMFPTLPYELIGKAVVTAVAIGLTIALAGGVVLGVGIAWNRFWAKLSNLCYRGYDIHDNRPPLWRLRLAGVTLAISRFRFDKIPASWREAEELADDERSFVRYLREVWDL